jgi:hypothetical protein
MNDKLKGVNALKKLVGILLLVGLLFTSFSTVSAHSSHEGNVKSHVYGKRVSEQLKDVKRATAKYQDYRVAESEGFINTHEFASDPELGGMGIHFVKPDRLGDANIKATEPEVLLYQPTKDGGYKLIAVEYYVPAALMDKTPVLFGRNFDGPVLNHDLDPNQLTDAEKNDRNSQHYDLHVWVWKHNPSGTFAPFNPNVKDVR